MDKETIIAQGKQAVIDGDAAESVRWTQTWIDQGLDPIEFIDNGLSVGIRIVGELWDEGEYFLPELVSGAEAMKAAMALLQPVLEQSRHQESSQQATIVIGTVQGDIHDIGKSLVGTLLRASGFRVIDLGADIAPDQFLETCRSEHAELLGISALLTTTMIGIKDVIDLFEQTGMRKQVKILVGGAPLTRKWAMDIGADRYGSSAVDAVQIAKALYRIKP